VIVVIGSPLGRLEEGVVVGAGTATRVAIVAAATGRDVQLVGRVGDDPVAHEILLDLSRRQVGHVALLRDPARPTPLEAPAAPDEDAATAVDDSPPGPTPVDSPPGPTPADRASLRPTLDAADVELGLRYLSDFEVVVVAEPASSDVLRVAAYAAGWSGARLLVVIGAGSELSTALPSDAIVFEAPDDDPDSAFATLVGRFAAALDDGAEPADAFRSSIAADGWTETVPE
jgi:hypothetical protein